MRLEIPLPQIAALAVRQLEALFMLFEGERAMIEAAMPEVMERCERTFSRNPNKYYRRGGEVYFNPFHSDQYASFLYLLSNTLSRRGGAERRLADRVFYLNKALNGLDLYHEIVLPEAFFLDHPVGTVLGRAVYGERFRVTQNCTVGNNWGEYPQLGENVRMLSGSKILGRCVIGDNVIIAANAFVKDEDVPPCSLVFGSSPSLVFKTRERAFFEGTLDKRQEAS